jgi:hypothetical protein
MSFLQLFQRINFFNGFEINIKFYVFYTNIAFLKEIFCLICTFKKNLNANADKTAQKTEICSYKCVLELNFATINFLGEPSC